MSSYRIVCIKKDNGNHENPHTAISLLGWIEDTTGKTGYDGREKVYDFVIKGGRAYVKAPNGERAYLIAAKTPRGTKYVKTIPDETKADNLLKLPECRV